MLENILETSRYVSDNSKYVRINKLAIDELVSNINFETTNHWLCSNPFGILDLEISDIINFLIIFDSIDCSFWGNPKWHIETDIGNFDGAFALMYSLMQLQRKNGHLDFEQISYDEFENILKGNVDIPLIKERYNTLKQVSEIINSKMNGSFYDYIKNITSDIDLFDIVVSNFPSFKDTRDYNEQIIYFYKLAQLLVSDILHIREIKENIKVDYTHLVGCADYKIPQVLRGFNILEYDNELSEMVDNEIEIEENSIYEVEIRANMIVAIDMIKERLNDIPSIEINDIIWSLGQDKSKVKKPYHRTRTMSY